MMDIKKYQASMVYKFFDKKSSGSSGFKNETEQNKKLAEELPTNY